jgi:3-hydroxyacyl-[acyl-carrier-protein] dehydratase
VIERIFQADHPAVQGHFPGNPIVPGAVLLSEVVQVIEAGLGAKLPSFHIAAARFLRPTRPGDRVLIDFSRDAGGAVRFSCSVAGTPVLTGQLSCHAESKAT